MKYLLLLPLLLAGLQAEASVEKTGKFDRYLIRQEGNQPFRFTVKTVVSTRDGCNYFGLSGGMRKAEMESGTLEQALVSDLGVIQTLMACPDLVEPRRIPLESQEFTIQPRNGMIYATVLIPDDMELVEKK